MSTYTTEHRYKDIVAHILRDGYEEALAVSYVFKHTVVTALVAYEAAGYGLRGKMGYFVPDSGGALHVQMYLPSGVDPAETCVEVIFTIY